MIENNTAMPEGITATTRWFGVGRSSRDLAREAAREAVDAAVRGQSPKLLIVFCSDR
jgi:hypothetical protein